MQLLTLNIFPAHFYAAVSEIKLKKVGDKFLQRDSAGVNRVSNPEDKRKGNSVADSVQTIFLPSFRFRPNSAE